MKWIVLAATSILIASYFSYNGLSLNQQQASNIIEECNLTNPAPSIPDLSPDISVPVSVDQAVELLLAVSTEEMAVYYRCIPNDEFMSVEQLHLGLWLRNNLNLAGSGELQSELTSYEKISAEDRSVFLMEKFQLMLQNRPVEN